MNYRGPNARMFKTQCASNAVDFAEGTNQTMVQMSDLVEGATSFIATRVGWSGRLIWRHPSVSVLMPVISADESVEAAEDTALLQPPARC